jgi:hypothetical protein
VISFVCSVLRIVRRKETLHLSCAYVWVILLLIFVRVELEIRVGGGVL